MQIVIGCDNAAVSLKNTLVKFLETKGVEVEDVGCYTSEDPISRRMETGGLCFLIFSFACLAVLGVSCGTWDLPSLFWQAGFLAEAWDPVP